MGRKLQHTCKLGDKWTVLFSLHSSKLETCPQIERWLKNEADIYRGDVDPCMDGTRNPVRGTQVFRKGNRNVPDSPGTFTKSEGTRRQTLKSINLNC